MCMHVYGITKTGYFLSSDGVKSADEQIKIFKHCPLCGEQLLFKPEEKKTEEKSWLVKCRPDVLGNYLFLENTVTGHNILLDLPRDVIITAHFKWDEPKKEKFYEFNVEVGQSIVQKQSNAGMTYFNFKIGDKVIVKRME